MPGRYKESAVSEQPDIEGRESLGHELQLNGKLREESCKVSDPTSSLTHEELEIGFRLRPLELFPVKGRRIFWVIAQEPPQFASVEFSGDELKHGAAVSLIDSQASGANTSFSARDRPARQVQRA